MKKFLISTFFVIHSLILFAQNLDNNVSFRSCAFRHPTDQGFIECYLSIGANGLKFMKDAQNNFQAGVEIQLLVLDGNQVINFDKYVLNSPSIQDTNAVTFALIDQRRFSIPDKVVSIEVIITDVHNVENTFTYREPVVPILQNEIQISDIQFVDAYKSTTEKNVFTKNNLELMPYPLNFFPSSKNSIIFYGEIYSTDQLLSEDQFLVTYSIIQTSNPQAPSQFTQFAKFDKAPVVSFLKEFDIQNLSGGNYYLIIEVRNKKNELITQKNVFIQRANKGSINYYENVSMVNVAGTFVDNYTEEQLNYFLDVIKPRSNSDEAKLIESLSYRVEADMKKKFLYKFWIDRNVADPYAAFLEYLDLVKKANESFGTPSKPGYKTDRGRVYLQYGPPFDRLSSASEPGAYPYEIWFYDKLPDNQTKIGFAFYEPSLVTNDYVLLHSNAKGELKDPRWKLEVYKNVASPQELYDYDNTEVGDQIGGQRVIDIYTF